MILKIRQNHLYTNDGWFLYSEICSVDWSNKMKGIASTEDIAKEYQEDDELFGKHKHRYFAPIKKDFHDKHPEEWIKVRVSFVNGTKEVWVVQAETYLLSDDGKTIERIF